MRKKLRIAAAVVCLLLLAAAVLLYALYRGTQHVPERYSQALEADPVSQTQASGEMVRRTTALLSDVKQPGRWQALFTQQQINGWLAVDLVENHADVLPPSLSDPRVVIDPERVMLFCRARLSGLDTVVTVTLEPHLPEPNVLALRICGARAGTVPIPLGEIIERLSEAASRAGYHVQWRQAQGDPVAVISIPTLRDTQMQRVVCIDTLRLGDGEIYFAGTTEKP